jgi:hypothetical protein
MVAGMRSGKPEGQRGKERPRDYSSCASIHIINQNFHSALLTYRSVKHILYFTSQSVVEQQTNKVLEQRILLHSHALRIKTIIVRTGDRADPANII